MNRINSVSGFRPFIFAGCIGAVQLPGIILACSQICQLLLAGGPVKAQRANIRRELTKK